MKRFSLSTKEKTFPDAYTADGSVFPIFTDYRRILRILRLLNDPEVLDGDKTRIALTLFYKSETPPESIAGLQWFINCGEVRDGGGDKDFDFEQDAREIYAAFMQVYHIDLLETDMHYWRFSILLDGLFACDNALSNKVRLRHMDDGESKRKSDLERAKRNVAISRSVSGADVALEKQIQERIKAGKPIHDLIGGDANV